MNFNGNQDDKRGAYCEHLLLSLLLKLKRLMLSVSCTLNVRDKIITCTFSCSDTRQHHIPAGMVIKSTNETI